MKSSKRLILTTVAAVHVALVLGTGASRLYAVNVEPAPKVATPAMLAQLRDFTTVNIVGDLAVEIVQQPEFSIEFFPAASTTAALRANIREAGVLTVFATNSPPGDRLRIGMPVLKQINVSRVEAMTISGFSGEALVLHTDGTANVELRNNAIAEWSVLTGGPTELKFDQASLERSRVRMGGQGVITLLE